MASEMLLFSRVSHAWHKGLVQRLVFFLSFIVHMYGRGIGPAEKSVNFPPFSPRELQFLPCQGDAGMRHCFLNVNIFSYHAAI